LALAIDLGAVMQPGRWKCNKMPTRYGEQVVVSSGRIAWAAQKQGRDAIADKEAK
jgi:hypothetical protein